MKLDGTTPTIMTAYGGFLTPQTLRYSAELGKLWLEQGAAFVLANIRGGGEFGPRWHDAGSSTNDDRVGPQHARKFATKLASLGVPYFYYEVVEGGHAGAATPLDRAQMAAREYAYFGRELGQKTGSSP